MQLLQQGLGVFPPAQLPGTSGAMDTQQLLQHQQHFMQQWQWSQLIQQQQMGMNMVPPLDGQVLIFPQLIFPGPSAARCCFEVIGHLG